MGMEVFQFQPSGACELVPKITEQHQRLYGTAALAGHYKGKRENERERGFWNQRICDHVRRGERQKGKENIVGRGYYCEEGGLGIREKGRDREEKKEK